MSWNLLRNSHSNEFFFSRPYNSAHEVFSWLYNVLFVSFQKMANMVPGTQRQQPDSGNNFLQSKIAH